MKLGEEVLEPDLPIIDAHHHLVLKPGFRYLLDEFTEDLASGHRVVATVYVESRAMTRKDGPRHLRPVGETEFANGVAAMSASGAYGSCRVAAAIMSYADLTLGAAVGEVLDAHIAAAPARFRGIRQGTYWDADSTVWEMGPSMRPDPGMLLADGFQRGFRELVARDLVFDAVVFHPQLSELSALADIFPSTTIVLNHMGFPLGVGCYAGRRQEVFETWRSDMVALARRENVLVKLGGQGIPLWGFAYDTRPKRPGSIELAQTWHPYVDACLELFGPKRCMFESNFPADRPSVDYRVSWNAMKRMVANCSTSEKESLFSGTARRAYRIAGVSGSD